MVYGLREALKNLAAAGVKQVWIDGSFITTKDNPNDIDGCWKPEKNCEKTILDPVFLDFRDDRKAMKKKYGVDFFLTGMHFRDGGGKTTEEFFQSDIFENPKGILKLRIG